MQFTSPVKHGGGYIVKVDGNDQYVRVDDAVVDLTTETISVSGEVESITQIDTLIKEAAKSHKKEWFGREVADSTLDKQYQPSIDGDGAITAHLAKSKGNVVTKFFFGRGSNRSEIKFSDIEEQTIDNCSVILQVVGVWFLRKTYQPVYRIVQVKSTPPKRKVLPQDCMFSDESDDEGEIDEPEVEDFFRDE